MGMSGLNYMKRLRNASEWTREEPKFGMSGSRFQPSMSKQRRNECGKEGLRKVMRYTGAVAETNKASCRIPVKLGGGVYS